MGYRLRTGTIGKRKVQSIRGYCQLEKFTIFGPSLVARRVTSFRICNKRRVTSEHIYLMLRKPTVEGEDDNENEDLVFLSPEESFPEKSPAKDQGASPILRRSNRKRKSVTDMSKGSSTKKKKTTSPAKQDNKPGKSMPRIPRTPQQQEQPPEGQASQEPGSKEPTAGFEALLLAMERRLAAKLEKASGASRQAAQQATLNSESLEQLESRVDANEDYIMNALK